MFREAKVVIAAADLDRSVAFYTEGLGLTLRVRHGDAWAEVEAPGLIVALHPVGDEPSPPPSGAVAIGLQVGDLEAAMAQLRDRGVTFDRVVEGFVRQAHFADPDGTRLYLAEVREEPPSASRAGRKAQGPGRPSGAPQ